jgi:hypothetical protein
MTLFSITTSDHFNLVNPKFDTKNVASTMVVALQCVPGTWWRDGCIVHNTIHHLGVTYYYDS